MDAAIWYCILKKQKVLAGLFKSVNDGKMSDFFGKPNEEISRLYRTLKPKSLEGKLL